MKTINVNDVIKSNKFNKNVALMFLFIMITATLNGFAVNIYGTVVATLMGELGMTKTTAGVLGSAAAYGMLVGAVFFPWLGSKIGLKKAIIVSVFWTAICMIIMSCSRSVQFFFIFRVLCGVSMAGAIPCLVGLIAELSPAKTQSTLVAAVSAGMPLGSGIVALIGSFLLASLGWRNLMRVQLLSLLFLIPFYIFVPESMRHNVKKNNSKEIEKDLCKLNPSFVVEPDITYTMPAKNEIRGSYAPLFKKEYIRNTILFGIAAIFTMFVNFGLTNMFPIIMMGMGFEQNQSTFFLSLFSFSALIGMPLSGRIMDWIGCKKTLIIQYILTAVFFFVLLIPMEAGFVGIVIFAAGMVFNGIQAGRNCYEAEVYPLAISSLILGYAIMMANIGTILGPTVSGILLDTNLPSKAIFAIYTIPLFIALIAIILVKKNNTEGENIAVEN